MKRPARKVLLLLGPRRARAGVPKVRVVIDSVRDLVTVELPGREKQSFANTRAGQAEAKSFAQAFYDEITKPKPAAVPEAAPTVRQLYQRYAAAMFGDLRPKTIVGHNNRWKRWELHAGHDTAADAVTLEHLDRFKADMLGQGYIANQVSAVLGLVKQVFRWGLERRVLAASDVPMYRIRMPRDAEKIEPAEYRIEDFHRLVPAIGSPQQATSWRAWAFLMIAGHQGARANAIRHLRVTDIRDGRIHWAKAWDKRHRDWSQPIRDGALSAILTALEWRERDGYTGPWLFYPRPKGRDGRRARSGRIWAEQHEPYTYAAFHHQLVKAERAAGVPHIDYRGGHGLRKMVAGEVLRATNNPKLAMDFIGDRDLSLITDYLKVREDEKDEVAAQLDAGDQKPETHTPVAPGVPEAETAPEEVGAVAELTESHRSDLNRRPLGEMPSSGRAAPQETSPAPAESATDSTADACTDDPKPAPESHPFPVQQDGGR